MFLLVMYVYITIYYCYITITYYSSARPSPTCGGRGAVRQRGRGGRPPRVPQRGPSTWGGAGPMNNNKK